MKIPIVITMIGLGLLSSIFAQDSIEKREERARKVAAYYQQASQAYNDGDLKAAKAAVKNALALNPRHAQSYALNLRLKKNGSSFKAKNRERKMKSIIIPQVQIEDLSLEEGLEILSKLIEKQTKDTYIPNFVIQDSSGILKTKKVSVNLRNIPASVVLQYLLDQSGAVARFDDYAVNIRSRKPLSKPSGEPETKPFGEK